MSVSVSGKWSVPEVTLYWEAQPLCTDVVLRWPHAGRSACWQVECRAYSISEYWNVQPQLRPNADSGGSGGRARYLKGSPVCEILHVNMSQTGRRGKNNDLLGAMRSPDRRVHGSQA